MLYEISSEELSEENLKTIFFVQTRFIYVFNRKLKSSFHYNI